MKQVLWVVVVLLVVWGIYAAATNKKTNTSVENLPVGEQSIDATTTDSNELEDSTSTPGNIIDAKVSPSEEAPVKK